MKKVYALLALCLTLLLLLCACAKPTQEQTSPEPGKEAQQTEPDDTLERPDTPDVPDAQEQQTAVFSASVLEMTEKTLLIEPEQGSAERASADRISVSLTQDAELLNLAGDSCTPADIHVGDTVEITYDGVIAESYPAQITARRVAVTAEAEQVLPLLTPVEGEWADVRELTGERVTVEESEDAFVLRALADLEKVELARVYYDATKQDYVQKDLLWMADVWESGSELAVIEKTPLDGPNLAISWQDEYGERARRLVLPVKVKVGDTLQRSVMISGYLPPFTPVELSAQVDSEGNWSGSFFSCSLNAEGTIKVYEKQTKILHRFNPHLGTYFFGNGHICSYLSADFDLRLLQRLADGKPGS